MKIRIQRRGEEERRYEKNKSKMKNSEKDKTTIKVIKKGR